MRMPRERTMLPWSGSAAPAMQRSSVDLPPPFPAISPIRSPGPRLNETFWKSVRGDATPTSRKLMSAMPNPGPAPAQSKGRRMQQGQSGTEAVNFWLGCPATAYRGAETGPRERYWM